jgi:P27 family predicted phage terminase small subunit
LKQLKGNPGNRPIKEEPQVTMGAPTPPDDLKGEAFAEWSRIVPDLNRAGLLAEIDRGYLVAYCEAWASFCEARESLHENGALIAGRDGGVVRNPAAMVMKDSLDMMLKFGAKFGLSPIDRARLGKVPDRNDEDEGPGATLLSILS